MLRTCLLLGCLATVVMAQSGMDMLGLETRRSRFYCQPVNNETEDTDLLTRYFPQEDDQVWTIWLQFPVISYLDPLRKEALFAVIIDLITDGDGGEDLVAGSQALTLENLCVGRYDQDDVSDYSEGVILNIYFNVEPYDSREVNRAFNTGFEAASDDDGDNRVIRFRGRDSIFLLGRLNNMPPTDFQLNPPASNTAFDDNHSDDPTFVAVLIYNNAGNQTEDDIGGDRGSFASNPDPINYGLEAGDIVFAVFGSIFLAILSGMIVLGFFIHPFFLS